MTDDTVQPERPMKVTPLDLRQSRFKTAMRGYDRTEVTTLLEAVADDYENTLRDNDRLRREMTRLEAVLGQHRELEGSLKSTLISAQKVADDLRETAQAEAARIVRDAESRAELQQQRAQARLEDVQREIDGLKMKRRETETGVEALISTLHNTLEFIREQESREERVTIHRSIEIARPA
ncbi:MAG: DivIVA domain-containing protein [Vicinamibacterales bacterium]